MENKQQDAVLGAWLVGPFNSCSASPSSSNSNCYSKGFCDLFTLCLPQTEVTETQRTTLSPPLVGRYKRPAASWVPNLPKKHTLVSGRALKGSSWGLLHSGFGEVRALEVGPPCLSGISGRGEQTQKLEAVGETTQSFDSLLSTHYMPGAVRDAGKASAIRPNGSLLRWTGMEGAGRVHQSQPAEGIPRTSLPSLEGRGVIQWVVSPALNVCGVQGA